MQARPRRSGLHGNQPNHSTRCPQFFVVDVRLGRNSFQIIRRCAEFEPNAGRFGCRGGTSTHHRRSRPHTTAVRGRPARRVVRRDAAHHKRRATLPAAAQRRPAGHFSGSLGASASLADAPHRLRLPSFRGNRRSDRMGSGPPMVCTRYRNRVGRIHRARQHGPAHGAEPVERGPCGHGV